MANAFFQPVSAMELARSIRNPDSIAFENFARGALEVQDLKVSKTSSDEAVETNLARIDADAKVEEIARMLGGVKITKQTLAHAREMLETG